MAPVGIKEQVMTNVGTKVWPSESDVLTQVEI